MTFEYDDKGKFFTDIISKTPTPVRVQTSTHLITGTVHIHRDERLKDELDRDELFLALTDASVLGQDGTILHETTFMAVRRAQIVWVIPDNEEEAKG